MDCEALESILSDLRGVSEEKVRVDGGFVGLMKKASMSIPSSLASVHSLSSIWFSLSPSAKRKTSLKKGRSWLIDASSTKPEGSIFKKSARFRHDFQPRSSHAGQRSECFVLGSTTVAVTNLGFARSGSGPGTRRGLLRWFSYVRHQHPPLA